MYVLCNLKDPDSSFYFGPDWIRIWLKVTRIRNTGKNTNRLLIYQREKTHSYIEHTLGYCVYSRKLCSVRNSVLSDLCTSMELSLVCCHQLVSSEDDKVTIVPIVELQHPL